MTGLAKWFGYACVMCAMLASLSCRYDRKEISAPAPAPATTRPAPPPTTTSTKTSSIPLPPPTPVPIARHPAKPTTQIIDIDTSASLITLHLKDVPLETILDELGKAAETEIHFSASSRPRRVRFPALVSSIDVDRQPFWTVFRDFCNNNGLRIALASYGSERTSGITIEKQRDEHADAPWTTAGPVMLVMESFERAGNIDLANAAARPDACTLVLNMLIEPKLRAGLPTVDCTITKAVDEHGVSLMKPQDAEPVPPTLWAPGAAGFVRFPFPLAIPANAGEKLALLRATMTFDVPQRALRVEVQDVLHAEPCMLAAAGRQIEVGPAEQSGGGYVVPLSFTRGDATEQQWQQMLDLPRFFKDIHLVDAKGKTLAGGPPTILSRGSVKVSASVRFEHQPEDQLPLRLVWEVPVENKPLHVEFELKDIPLP